MKSLILSFAFTAFSINAFAQEVVTLAVGQSAVLCHSDSEVGESRRRVSGVTQLNQQLLRNEISITVGDFGYDQKTLVIKAPFNVSAPSTQRIQLTSTYAYNEICVTLTKR